jgi:ABC-type glycerol-3-phosphate transport system substrate-binding protein
MVLVLFGVFFFWWQHGRVLNVHAMDGIPKYEGMNDQSILMSEDIKLEPSYLKYYNAKKKAGVQDTTGVRIVIPGTAYNALSPSGAYKQSGIGGSTTESLVLSDENSWAEYTVDAPEDGFYQMGITYYALKGKHASVLRNVQIDGEFPFFQAKKLEFQRMWREAGPVLSDNQGNEFNPRQEEVANWQNKEFRDPEAKVAEPFRFHLTKGKHLIRIQTIREPAAIGELNVYSPERLMPYQDIQKQYQEKGYKETKKQLIKVQAESAVLKSDPTLRRVEDREPATEPFNKKGVGLNTFGGAPWRNGGQWAEWEVEAPESGLYNIGIRFGSWFLDSMPVQRRILIDGKIPFQEMNAVNFDYAGRWQMIGLGGSDKPYKYYLEKGKHRIRLEVQVGALGEVFENVQDVSQKMSLLSREVLLFTGTNPDPNRIWELDKNIPNLVPRLQLMARELDNSIQKLVQLGVAQGSSQISPIAMARDQVLNMAKDPDTIPGRLKQISDTQSSLGTWINGLIQQSLIVDYIVIKSPDKPWPKAEANVVVRAWYSFQDFLLSFKKDYRGIGNIYGEGKTLNIWISRGRDWAEIIKRLADEEFTPSTGIKVNINVVPAGDKSKLMLSTTAGLQPDVALGVEGEIPIDFAIRGALVNMNKFPDYAEVAARFRPGALIPYKYNGGDYALPENQNFNMLFYRKDIMDQLGVKKIPDTWEEVMDLIPILQQKGMDFYYPHAPNNPSLAINEFTPFLFQNGGEFYRDNGMFSNLDSPEAMKGLKLWSGLFTNYKINKDANFFNRFRTGEMPIGVADYSTYVLLSTAAHELSGWWGMKPMPGIRQADGKINRSTGGLAQTAVLFENSSMQKEGWEFMKWWTGADVQEQFGNELESLLGVEARWNTANVEALKRLPWQSQDINAILQQWDWFKERQVVLGGYYTTRYIANIWNEIVLNGKNPRESVEDGVIEINKELRKKREEFGLNTSIDGQQNAEGGGTR